MLQCLNVRNKCPAPIFIFTISLLLVSSALARIVDSEFEVERLSGFLDHERQNADFEKWRLSDVGNLRDQRKLSQLAEKQNILEFHNEKRAENLVEGGPEYLRDLQFRMRVLSWEYVYQKSFVSQREDIRKRQRSDVNISEVQELKIFENGERVDWKKRKFFASSGGSSTSGGTSTPGFNNYNGRFENPPPPPPFEGEFYEEVPPPPPPIFDEPPPPPPPSY